MMRKSEYKNVIGLISIHLCMGVCVFVFANKSKQNETKQNSYQKYKRRSIMLGVS
jgi:hypothetical protein